MKSLRSSGAAILLLSLLACPAVSDPSRRPLSSTGAFAIDGKNYRLEKSAGDDLSLIRKELSRRGLDAPLGGGSASTHPCFVDALREDPRPAPMPSLPVPQGLRPDHVLRLESTAGPVAFAFGSMHVHGRQVSRALLRSGWKCVDAGSGDDSVTMATRKNGRETFVVILEEKERTFLFARKLER